MLPCAEVSDTKDLPMMWVVMTSRSCSTCQCGSRRWANKKMRRSSCPAAEMSTDPAPVTMSIVHMVVCVGERRVHPIGRQPQKPAVLSHGKDKNRYANVAFWQFSLLIIDQGTSTCQYPKRRLPGFELTPALGGGCRRPMSRRPNSPTEGQIHRRVVRLEARRALWPLDTRGRLWLVGA